jgi:hypothetical protein
MHSPEQAVVVVLGVFARLVYFLRLLRCDDLCTPMVFTYTPRYQAGAAGAAGAAAHLHGLLVLDRGRRGGARTGGGLRVRAQGSDTGPVLESRLALAHTLAAGFFVAADCFFVAADCFFVAAGCLRAFGAEGGIYSSSSR